MTDEQITAYLLEELTAEESERFEDELFAADEWETDIQGVEDDLIDAYLRRELSPERTRRFEDNYLCTEARRERARLAAAILRRADELTPAADPKPTEEPGWWQKISAGWNSQPAALRAVAVIAVLVLFAGAVWFVGFRGQRQPMIATLSLSLTNSTRSSAPGPNERINLQGKDLLKLSLALPETLPATSKCDPEILDGAGRSVSVGSSTRNGANLILEIPAAQLRPGTYQIKVSASENGNSSTTLVGYYRFVVE